MSYSELLLGCGFNRRKMLPTIGHPAWENLTTLDINPRCEPDVLHDLEVCPWPFHDNEFDELHAIEVCEHVTGQQGDAPAFFRFFEEAWRILKSDGHFCATVPLHDHLWTWGDPGHKRVINEGTLIFLSQRTYAQQLRSTPTTDYRSIYQADFEVEDTTKTQSSLVFVLKAIKPARYGPIADVLHT